MYHSLCYYLPLVNENFFCGPPLYPLNSGVSINVTIAKRKYHMLWYTRVGQKNLLLKAGVVPLELDAFITTDVEHEGKMD